MHYFELVWFFHALALGLKTLLQSAAKEMRNESSAPVCDYGLAASPSRMCQKYVTVTYVYAYFQECIEIWNSDHVTWDVFLSENWTELLLKCNGKVCLLLVWKQWTPVKAELENNQLPWAEKNEKYNPCLSSVNPFSWQGYNMNGKWHVFNLSSLKLFTCNYVVLFRCYTKCDTVGYLQESSI